MYFAKNQKNMVITEEETEYLDETMREYLKTQAIKPQILIVDDSDMNREILTEILHQDYALPSYIWYDDSAWNVSESAINVIGKDIRIDNLTAACGGQSIKIDGGYSSTRNDTLSLNMVRFDIGLLNKFIGERFGVSGLATGHAIVSSPWKTNPGAYLYAGKMNLFRPAEKSAIT